MKNTIKTLFLAMLIATSLTTYGQSWNLKGNDISVEMPPPALLKLGTLDASELPFYTHNKRRMTLAANGWLGLGTSVPDANQEVYYTPTTSSGENGVLITLNSTNPNGITHNVSTPDRMGGGVVEAAMPGPYPVSYPPTAAFDPPFSFRTGNVTTPAQPLYTVNEKPMFWVRTKAPRGMLSNLGTPVFDTKFIVMPDGSCGINITNPRAALDVRGSQIPNRPAAIFGSRAIGTDVSDEHTGLTQYYTQMIQIVPQLTENGYNQIVRGGDQGMFFTDGQGTDGANGEGSFVLAPWASDRNAAIGGMRMDAEGNTEFHGTFRATEVKINAQWWSDFVFDDDYKLMTLGQVENFINKYKHLPNVPSEKQVLEDGINVAEMQAIQQQKIEELTLYLIELKKELDALKTEVATQKSSSH